MFPACRTNHRICRRLGAYLRAKVAVPWAPGGQANPRLGLEPVNSFLLGVCYSKYRYLLKVSGV